MLRASSSSVLAFTFACVGAGVLTLAVPSDAQACGGVFVPAPTIEQPSSSSIVRDHRMAIAIGRTKTVIWDEVRLEGNPRDFVWITPVKPGTVIQLADDEWLSALDVSTQPVVYGPRYRSRGGCALAGCASDQDTDSNAPNDSVFIVKEEVLGPYDSVTVRAAGDPDAPYRWLQENGYRIDDTQVRAVLASYASQGFDFAALKLRATCNQTAMQPVRIVIPGTDPRILIRMALAGARIDAVPISLFVLAEAPYRPANYPFGFIDDDALEWDRSTSSSSSSYYAPRSNYDPLANTVMAKDARTWLVESAQLAELGSPSGRLPTPGLFEAYDALCRGATPPKTGTRTGGSSSSSGDPGVKAPCNFADAGVRDGSADGSAGDGGGAGDAGDDDDAGDASTDASTLDDGGGGDSGNVADAGNDAGEIDEDDSGTQTEFDAGVSAPRCQSGSDSDFFIATRDVIGTTQIWVTRMRARIQPNALDADLTLTPAVAPDNRAISNLHQVARYDDEDDRPDKTSCRTTKIVRHGKREPAGTWALGTVAAIVLTAWLRRKKKKKS
jgi:hypothetical protein